MTDQLTEEEEKTKSLNKLKNKQEAVIADLEGNFSQTKLDLTVLDRKLDFLYSDETFLM